MALLMGQTSVFTNVLWQALYYILRRQLLGSEITTKLSRPCSSIALALESNLNAIESLFTPFLIDKSALSTACFGAMILRHGASQTVLWNVS